MLLSYMPTVCNKSICWNKHLINLPLSSYDIARLKRQSKWQLKISLWVSLEGKMVYLVRIRHTICSYVSVCIYPASGLSVQRSARRRHSHGHSHSVCSTRWQLRHIRSTCNIAENTSNRRRWQRISLSKLDFEFKHNSWQINSFAYCFPAHHLFLHQISAFYFV